MYWMYGGFVPIIFFCLGAKWSGIFLLCRRPIIGGLPLFSAIWSGFRLFNTFAITILNFCFRIFFFNGNTLFQTDNQDLVLYSPDPIVRYVAVMRRYIRICYQLIHVNVKRKRISIHVHVGRSMIFYEIKRESRIFSKS